jgi:hypothetical protein
VTQPDITSLRLPDPLALVDATLAFTVQVLIAQHPELLLPPEIPVLRPPPGLRAAHHVLDAIKNLHRALESYQAIAADPRPDAADPAPRRVDDIPF